MCACISCIPNIYFYRDVWVEGSAIRAALPVCMFKHLEIYIVDSWGSDGVWSTSWMTAVVAISLHYIENNNLYVNICLVNNILSKHDAYSTCWVEVSTMCWSCKLQDSYVRNYDIFTYFWVIFWQIRYRNQKRERNIITLQITAILCT